MRTGEIKALSGLRIVAAVWVVLFHFRPWLEVSAPGFRSALAPVINCGAQGVDLFFILSGFVLTWNYLDRMGESFSMKATLHFLWLRLARVWPVYVVTLHLALAWIIFTLYVGHLPSPVADQLSAVSYARQVLLVQLWFQPFFDGSSWDGPAWSISAEWLAYLLFGVLVLVIFRIARATRVRGLLWLAVAASLAAGAALAGDRPLLHPVELAAADRHAVHRGRAGMRRGSQDGTLRGRPSVGAGYLSVVSAPRIVGILYFLDAHPVAKVSDSSGLVDVLFVPLVASLAVGIGSLPRLLSTRIMVYGGYISFSLYMVHEFVHTAWNWFTAQFEIILTPSWSAKLIMVGVFAVAFARCRCCCTTSSRSPPASGCAAWSRRDSLQSIRWSRTPTPMPGRSIRHTASSNPSTAPAKSLQTPSPCARGLTDGTDPNSAARDDIAAIL